MLKRLSNRFTAFIAVIVLVNAGNPAIAVCPSAATIDDPAPGTYFSTTANIACGGGGEPVGAGFTVQIVDANDTVLQSTGSSIQQNLSWQATLNAPSNGWPAHTALTIQTVCSGKVLNSTDINIR